ncbi:MAG: polysaccharide biosynthesis/export family protein [Tannerella sp.]|nr:polysaccharide biosynthesis/export family protein [Tannerella sp.]
MKYKFVFLLCIALQLVSCSTPRDVIYFQGIDDLTKEQMSKMAQTYSANICEDDLLTITVTAWDPAVVIPFNPPSYAFAQPGETNIYNAQQLQTYLVDKEGMINFPVLGRVKAAGLTKQELSKNLQEAISKYAKDAMVNIQIVNYKISVLGEVSRPGSITVRNDRITILDAIAQSGDLTINGNRKNILIYRDESGSPEYGRVDLTDPALFTSPYYYLKQNDVVYVEPNEAKIRNANYSAAQQYTLTIVSTIMTGVSVISTIILAISR